MHMDQKQITKYKKLLLEERQRILNASRKGLEDIKVDIDDLPDETDQAASEVNQSLAFKLRDRERILLSKIDEALARIDEGTFGTCKDCEEPIETKRLDARPVTTLCLACKEKQEHREKIFVG